MGHGVLPAVCCILLAGCLASTDSTRPAETADPQPPPVSTPEVRAGWDVPAPRTVADHTPPALPQYVTEGQLFYGAYATQSLPSQNIVASEHRAAFYPSWVSAEESDFSNVAYAIYPFNLAHHEGPAQVELVWEENPPEPGMVYIGTADFDANHWLWSAAPADWLLTLDAESAYASEAQLAPVAVVLLGQTPAVLGEIVFGNREMVENVDFTRLYAPPLDFETGALEADWAARNTTPETFEVLHSAHKEGGYELALISYMVDGLQLYGSVAVPDHDPGDKLGVLVFCHPGATGVSADNMMLLANLLTDADLRNRFVLVTPSFRGEALMATDLGALFSEGPGSLYDHDADDTLALLNGTLATFPEADASLMLAFGFSRGGQVAQRIAERDPRIRGCIVFAGMTDEWTAWGQATAYNALANMQEPEPSEKNEWLHMLWELRFGHQDIWTGRRLLLSTSTTYFADRIGRVQAHYGGQDASISSDQGQRLYDVMLALGRDSDIEFYVYPEGGHEWFFDEGSPEHFTDFVASFMAAP